jgi:myo-inositol-1(or 4)-monophosphatase
MANTRLEMAVDAAIQSGKLLQDLFQKGNLQGSLKADQTLITEADQAADRLIQEIILREFPDDQILSEEGNTIFPNDRHVWVIDPLDGTVNFSLGLNYWGVSIAHLENGYPETAALYFPETEELFSAVKGQGAELNGVPLQVSEQKREVLFPIFVHCSRMDQRYMVNLPYKKRSLGAAAYHLCLISKNTAILAFESSPKIWDYAGSWLIVSEAGGVIGSLGEEQPFPAQAGADYQKISFSIAAAASDVIMAEAKENIILL